MTLDDLMQCTDVSTSMKELHEEFSLVPFSHCVVATDLAVIEEQLAAELPVSLMCNSQGEHFRLLREQFRNLSFMLTVNLSL